MLGAYTASAAYLWETSYIPRIGLFLRVPVDRGFSASMYLLFGNTNGEHRLFDGSLPDDGVSCPVPISFNKYIGNVDTNTCLPHPK